MNLAISNIAWRREDDPAIAAIMGEFGVGGVEIAPTVVWPVPNDVADSEVAGYRAFWRGHGVQIVALQSLLFGRPDLTIFRSAEARRRTLGHLAGMIRLGAALGARALVFGSPVNRVVNGLDPVQRDEIAVEFFGAAGEEARAAGVILCLEPNPVQYGCDYINTSAEALALVRAVGSDGFGLHLDAGGLLLSEERAAPAIERCASALRHFHASEPFLAPLGTGGVDHAAMAAALRGHGYSGWVSVEMKRSVDGDPRDHVRRALETLTTTYGAPRCDPRSH